MISKDEIEKKKSVLKLLRLTMPPLLFIIVLWVLSGVIGLSFGISALIALLLAGAEYVAFSLMLNRWAGL